MRRLAVVFAEILLTVTACKRAEDHAGGAASDGATIGPPPSVVTASPSAAPPSNACDEILYCNTDRNAVTGYTLRDRCLPTEAAIATCTMNCTSRLERRMCVSKGGACSKERPTGLIAGDCQSKTFPLPCGLDASQLPIPKEECQKFCPAGADHCAVRDQPPMLTCSSFCGVGRVGEGQPYVARPQNAGEYFALCATLEQRAAGAFERLARELDFHGAPGSLVRRCEEAAREERKHAALMRREARRRGAVPLETGPAPQSLRPLFDVAHENAVEGVRETAGALLLHHQAAGAEDASLRRILASIARDETSHAELSWAITDWAQERLSAAENALIRGAMREALDDVAAAPAPLTGEDRRDLGLADDTTRRALVRELAAFLSSGPSCFREPSAS